MAKSSPQSVDEGTFLGEAWSQARRAAFALFATAVAFAGSAFGPAASDYPSVQEAIDRNPGRRIFVPAGDHEIHEALHLRTNGSGLWGPGRIVQTNPEAAIVDASGVRNIMLQGLTLTRPEGRMETHRPAVFIENSGEIDLNEVQLPDNRGDLATVYIRCCSGVRIQDCLVRNYSRISIDDRRRRPGYPDFDVVGGYAFNTISGTGIGIRACNGVLLRNNRVIEDVMIPTPELKAKYKLGAFSAKEAKKGTGLPQTMWDAEYNNAWHQGSAIALANVETDPLVGTNPFIAKETPPPSGPGTDHYFQVIGNYIENAPQGMDIHVDNAIVAGNIVNNAFMGMKAMHGARNVIILGNQFVRTDLWAIMLMPGTVSHPPLSAQGDQPAREANIDGGTVIANNIISDFGYGHARWIWKDSDPTPLFFNGDQRKPDIPPLHDVIVEGNMIYDSGRDQVLVDGKPRSEPPHYRHAVKIATGVGAPKGLHFANNLLHAGTEDISNIALPAAEPMVGGN
jgi:hypothetical protein